MLYVVVSFDDVTLRTQYVYILFTSAIVGTSVARTGKVVIVVSATVVVETRGGFSRVLPDNLTVIPTYAKTLTSILISGTDGIETTGFPKLSMNAKENSFVRAFEQDKNRSKLCIESIL